MAEARVRRRGKKGKTRTTSCDLWPGERGREARRRRGKEGGRETVPGNNHDSSRGVGGGGGGGGGQTDKRLSFSPSRSLDLSFSISHTKP